MVAIFGRNMAFPTKWLNRLLTLSVVVALAAVVTKALIMTLDSLDKLVDGCIKLAPIVGMATIATFTLFAFHSFIRGITFVVKFLCRYGEERGRNSDSLEVQENPISLKESSTVSSTEEKEVSTSEAQKEYNEETSKAKVKDDHKAAIDTVTRSGSSDKPQSDANSDRQTVEGTVPAKSSGEEASTPTQPKSAVDSDKNIEEKATTSTKSAEEKVRTPTQPTREVDSIKNIEVTVAKPANSTEEASTPTQPKLGVDSDKKIPAVVTPCEKNEDNKVPNRCPESATLAGVEQNAGNDKRLADVKASTERAKILSPPHSFLKHRRLFGSARKTPAISEGKGHNLLSFNAESDKHSATKLPENSRCQPAQPSTTPPVTNSMKPGIFSMQLSLVARQREIAQKQPPSSNTTFKNASPSCGPAQEGAVAGVAKLSLAPASNVGSGKPPQNYSTQNTLHTARCTTLPPPKSATRVKTEPDQVTGPPSQRNSLATGPKGLAGEPTHEVVDLTEDDEYDVVGEENSRKRKSESIFNICRKRIRMMTVGDKEREADSKRKHSRARSDRDGNSSHDSVVESNKKSKDHKESQMGGAATPTKPENTVKNLDTGKVASIPMASALPALGHHTKGN